MPHGKTINTTSVEQNLAMVSLFLGGCCIKILLEKHSFQRFHLLVDGLHKKLYPVTYYRIDTASMFMSYAQSSVLKIIDEITNNKGTRALTENERKPVLK